MKRALAIGLVISMFLFIPQAFAATEDKPSRMGLSTGPLLPKGVSGVREIVPLTALRYGTASAFGFFEAEGAAGNANGNFYAIVSGRLVYDYELGPTTGLFFIGGDIHYFKTVRKIRTIFINDSTNETTEEISFEPGNFRRFNGWHLGFGVKTDITKRLFLRGDMLLRYSPGNTGYIGMGIEFLLDEGSS